MSLWPGIPQIDFSTASSGTLVQEMAGVIDSTGIASNFTGLVSTPNAPFNSQFQQAMTDAQGMVINGMSGLPPNFQINGATPSFAPADNEGLTSKIKVRLVPVNKQSLNSNDGIILDVTPVITESRQASWDSISVTHHPGEILAYKTTTSRTWDISAIKLISRTPDEARNNLILLNKIRSWVMPYYGYGTEKSQKNKLGAPPTILTFSAYGSPNIGPVPVVLLSYNFSYPNDVDYIPCSELANSGEEVIVKGGTPFPIISELTLNLKESYSPREFSSFDIIAYKNGDMENAYNVFTNGPGEATPKTTTTGTETPRAEPESSNIQESISSTPLPIEVAAPSLLDLETGINW